MWITEKNGKIYSSSISDDTSFGWVIVCECFRVWKGKETTRLRFFQRKSNVRIREIRMLPVYWHAVPGLFFASQHTLESYVLGFVGAPPSSRIRDAFFISKTIFFLHFFKDIRPFEIYFSSEMSKNIHENMNIFQKEGHSRPVKCSPWWMPKSRSPCFSQYMKKSGSKKEEKNRRSCYRFYRQHSTHL